MKVRNIRRSRRRRSEDKREKSDERNNKRSEVARKFFYDPPLGLPRRAAKEGKFVFKGPRARKIKLPELIKGMGATGARAATIVGSAANNGQE